MKRILIVEDIGEVRQWLSEIALAAFGDPAIDAAAGMREAFSMIARHPHDLALVDLGLPDGDGLEVLRRLRAERPGTVGVVTTAMGDDAHIVAALAAGAEGYLLKEQPKSVLVRQLTQLEAGIPALSPPVARRIMAHFRHTGPVAEPNEKLTPREREVLTLIAGGHRIADAATALQLAESTVATHIKSIYRKLGIHSRAEASFHAARMGLFGEGG